MPWTAWILASAVMLAFYDLAKKHSVRENAVLPVLLVATSCGAAVYTASLAAAGGLAEALHPSARESALVAVKSVVVASSWVFTYRALRTLPITVATPIRASAPAFVFLAALFLYGERPSAVQGLGMLLVFAGNWAFGRAGRHEGIDFLHDRAVWSAFAGMALSAVSSLWDKFILQRCALPVERMQLWFQIDLVLVYALLLAARSAFAPERIRFRWRWTIPAVGILLAGADWLYFRGLAIPGVPISAASLMRRFSVAVTFALGAALFRERNLGRKALALSGILAGIALICLG